MPLEIGKPNIKEDVNLPIEDTKVVPEEEDKDDEGESVDF